MLIDPYFDEANKDRRNRINNTALQTADKLNRRMKQFINDTNKSFSLTKGQKNKIREHLLKDL